MQRTSFKRTQTKVEEGIKWKKDMDSLLQLLGKLSSYLNPEEIAKQDSPETTPPPIKKNSSHGNISLSSPLEKKEAISPVTNLYSTSPAVSAYVANISPEKKEEKEEREFKISSPTHKEKAEEKEQGKKLRRRGKTISGRTLGRMSSAELKKSIGKFLKKGEKSNANLSSVVQMHKKDIFSCSLSEAYFLEMSASRQLEEKPPALRVPMLLVKLISLIEKNGGLQQEGIFRISPNMPDIQKLKTKITKLSEKRHADYSDLKCDSPHLAATTLKQWIQSLPVPIFPDYEKCLLAESEKEILSLVRVLPAANERVLLYLLQFLRQIASSEKTKMTMNALSLVWVPSLLRNPVQLDLESTTKNMAKEAKFVSSLFEHHPEHLIGYGAVGSKTKVPSLCPLSLSLVIKTHSKKGQNRNKENACKYTRFSS